MSARTSLNGSQPAQRSTSASAAALIKTPIEIPIQDRRLRLGASTELTICSSL
jgi:hypothetical protein